MLLPLCSTRTSQTGRSVSKSAMAFQMEIVIKRDCKDVDWAAVSEILKKVNMGYHEPDIG